MSDTPDLDVLAQQAAAEQARAPEPPSLRLQPKPLIDKETD